MTDKVQTNYWEILAPIWGSQEATDPPIRFFSWFNQLSEAQKILFPTHWLCSEVYNGGFHQYFTNPTGIHAPEALVGFQKLGLHDIGNIVEEAIAVFGEQYPREQASRIKILESYSGDKREEWDPFFRSDERFYAAIQIPGAPPLHNGDRFTVAADKYASRIQI